MSTEYIADHEPLSIEEIVEILKQAKIEYSHRNGRTVSHLQVRLGIGMVGSTMPDNDESNVCKAKSEMYSLFMEFIESEFINANAMAMVLYLLMQTK